MSVTAKPEPADLAEVKSRLKSGPREQYFYVALLGLRNYEPLKIYHHVKSGFAYSAFERFQESMAIDRVPEPLRSLVYESQRIEQDVVVGYWDEVLRSDAEELQARIDAGIASTDVPVLAVLGRVLPDTSGHGLARVRDLELEEWPGLGHFPHLVQPDRFAARLRAFIDRVTI